MQPCHPKHVPNFWLMTDERQGEDLWRALGALPRGAGVIVRHYRWPLPARRALFARIERVARQNGLVVIRAGADRLSWREQGLHGRMPGGRGNVIRTWPAHNLREILAGIRAGADAILVSPIFATRTHPDSPALGISRAGLMVNIARATHPSAKLIALGGVNAQNFRQLRQIGFDGWAGIDGWLQPAGANRSKFPLRTAK